MVKLKIEVVWGRAPDPGPVRLAGRWPLSLAGEVPPGARLLGDW